MKRGKNTFVVELPIVTKPEQLELPVFTKPQPSKPVAPSATDSQKLAGAKILLVDDEPIILSFISQVLTEEGHEVETVDNASDALEVVKNKNYRLILLDIKMPGISGIELYEHFQRMAKSLAGRVVVITGDVLGQDTTDFLCHTEVPFIYKPFQIDQLRRVIAPMLANAE